MLTLHNFLHPSLKAGFLKHPGLEPQTDLAHFAVSEQGKARPEAKASEAIPGHHHQPREEMLQSGGPEDKARGGRGEATASQGMF